MAEVVVIGCGGVGLPFAVALANHGARVLGLDEDVRRVRTLNAGEADLEDVGLGEALNSALQGRRLSFAVAAEPAVESRAWVIAVPTPVGQDLRLDDSAIRSAFTAVLDAARPGDLVMVRSTTPVGFTRTLANRAAGRGLLFASCPDRSLAGAAYAEHLTIPHIVGGLDEAGSRAAEAVLQCIGKVVRVSSPEAAEALKLFANVWRDARFALANELALFCGAAGLDFAEIRAAGALDFARSDIPRAGPVGGPCLTKDVYLLAQSAELAETGIPLMLEARRLNDSLMDYVAEAILKESRAGPQPPRVAILGLAFKGVPRTLDRRGSVGMALLERLRGALPEADLRAWDPSEDPPRDGALLATRDATIIVLTNDHPDLADHRNLAGCAPGALVLDLCGVLDEPWPPGLRVRRFGSGRLP